MDYSTDVTAPALRAALAQGRLRAISLRDPSAVQLAGASPWVRRFCVEFAGGSGRGPEARTPLHQRDARTGNPLPPCGRGRALSFAAPLVIEIERSSGFMRSTPVVTAALLAGYRGEWRASHAPCVPRRRSARFGADGSLPVWRDVSRREASNPEAACCRSVTQVLSTVILSRHSGVEDKILVKD